MKKTTLFAAIFLLALAMAQGAESREILTLAAADLKALAIDCGAGSLKVQGQEGLERIEVGAILRVGGVGQAELREFRREHVALKLEKVGDKAVLTAEIRDHFSLERLLAGGLNAAIDLDVRLPRRLALEVEDGSGDARLTDIRGGVDIEDGSGDLRLENLGGRVAIEDGSGDIELDGAGGDVDIEDGSGGMRVQHVRGSLRVDDGSGGIVIDGVAQDVTIEEAGSGGLEIRNVKGQVRK